MDRDEFVRAVIAELQQQAEQPVAQPDVARCLHSLTFDMPELSSAQIRAVVRAVERHLTCDPHGATLPDAGVPVRTLFRGVRYAAIRMPRHASEEEREALREHAATLYALVHVKLLGRIVWCARAAVCMHVLPPPHSASRGRTAASTPDAQHEWAWRELRKLSFAGLQSLPTSAWARLDLSLDLARCACAAARAHWCARDRVVLAALRALMSPPAQCTSSRRGQRCPACAAGHLDAA